MLNSTLLIKSARKASLSLFALATLTTLFLTLPSYGQFGLPGTPSYHGLNGGGQTNGKAQNSNKSNAAIQRHQAYQRQQGKHANNGSMTFNGKTVQRDRYAGRPTFSTTVTPYQVFAPVFDKYKADYNRLGQQLRGLDSRYRQLARNANYYERMAQRDYRYQSKVHQYHQAMQQVVAEYRRVQHQRQQIKLADQRLRNELRYYPSTQITLNGEMDIAQVLEGLMGHLRKNRHKMGTPLTYNKY